MALNEVILNAGGGFGYSTARATKFPESMNASCNVFREYTINVRW